MASLLSEINLPLLVLMLWVVNFHLLSGGREHRGNDSTFFSECRENQIDKVTLCEYISHPTCSNDESRVLPSRDKEFLHLICAGSLKTSATDDIREAATNSASRGGGMGVDWVIVGVGLFLLGLAVAGCAWFPLSSKRGAESKKNENEIRIDIEDDAPNLTSSGNGDEMPTENSDRLSPTIDDIEPSSETKFPVTALLRSTWRRKRPTDDDDSDELVSQKIHVTHDDSIGDMTLLDLENIRKSYMQADMENETTPNNGGYASQRGDAEPTTAPSTSSKVTTEAPGEDSAFINGGDRTDASVPASKTTDAHDETAPSHSGEERGNQNEKENGNVDLSDTLL